MAIVYNPFTGELDYTGTATGGGGSVAGSSGQIQYNNSGSFGGATGLEFDPTRPALVMTDGNGVRWWVEVDTAGHLVTTAVTIASRAGMSMGLLLALTYST